MKQFRSWPRRLGPLAAIVALALLLSAQGVSAGRAWCQADPVLTVNGIAFDVWITGQPPGTGQPVTPTGTIQLVVHVPNNASAGVVSLDDGWGYGYQITFTEDRAMKATATGIDVRVDVYAATSVPMPVRVNIAPRTNTGLLPGSSAWGQTDSWFTTTSCGTCR